MLNSFSEHKNSKIVLTSFLGLYIHTFTEVILTITLQINVQNKCS